jgi:hypothetical protein
MGGDKEREERETLRRLKAEQERYTQLRLKQLREARLSLHVDPSDVVRVALIDFAHALPGTGGRDEGYLHGLHGLITRLRGLLLR